jgi:hypothetical protein
MKIARVCTYGCGLLLLVLSAAATVFAGVGVDPAPEIDAGSIVSGVGLLAASVMILRARMRSSK